MKWIASASPREDDPHERHGPACRQAGRVVASLHSASREDDPFFYPSLRALQIF